MRGMIITTVLIAAAFPAYADDTFPTGIAPAAPLIEHTAFGDSLNFDIVIHNPRAEALRIGSIQIDYIEASGTVLYSRTMDFQGRGLETIPERGIEANADRLLYNPFPVLPAGVHPAGVVAHVSLFKWPLGHPTPDTSPIRVLTLDYTATLAEPHPPRLILPLKGRVLVWDGHDIYSHHRRWDYSNAELRRIGYTANFARYSYDFVIVDEHDRMMRSDEDKNENYFGFGQPVYAPGDGTVVEMHDGDPDNRQFDMEAIKANQNSDFGNYIIIDHGGGYFSLLGHVHQGSVRARPGDRVKAGQQIAEVGASGSSLFPHLHYQLMNGFRRGVEGVPSYFDGIARVRGRARVPVLPNTGIDSGDIVISP